MGYRACCINSNSGYGCAKDKRDRRGTGNSAGGEKYGFLRVEKNVDKPSGTATNEFEKKFEQSEQVEQTKENNVKTVDFEGWRWRTNTFFRGFGLFNRLDRLKAEITVLFVLASVYVTLRGSDEPMVYASIYLLTIGVIVGLDSICAFRSFLASVTRYMILGTDCMVVSSLWIDNDNYRILTVAVFVLTLIYTIFFNGRVLMGENYKYSEAVQHAVKSDPDNETGEAWRCWGKVACRTVYGEIGYKFDDKHIDGLAKPIFYLTYFRCKGFEKKNRELIESQRKTISENQNVIEELQRKVDSLYEDSQELEEYRIDVKVFRERVEKLEKENKMLATANEYMSNNPEVYITEVKTEETDVEKYLLMTETERAFELFKRGYRNVDVEKKMGKSKSTVSGWRKKYEETLEEET